MTRLKKQTCLAALLVVFLAASFASTQTSSISYVEFSDTAGSENSRAQGASYESGGIIILDRVAKITDADGQIRVFRENPSVVIHRLHKEAEKALRSEQRATWRVYVTEHRRSMTDGGKNSKISSPNLLRDRRDALRPVYFA